MNQPHVKVILYMAMSVNGYIAEPDGGEDFLSHTNWTTLLELIKQHRSLIWGSHTYHLVKDWPSRFFTTVFKQATKVIVSSQSLLQLEPGYALASSPRSALTTLAELGFKSTILTGGSTINTSFAREHLIDEVILNFEPTLLGQGINLFRPEVLKLQLKYQKHLVFPSGIVQLHYKVK